MEFGGWEYKEGSIEDGADAWKVWQESRNQLMKGLIKSYYGARHFI